MYTIFFFQKFPPMHTYIFFRLGGSSHRGFLYYSNYCVCMYICMYSILVLLTYRVVSRVALISAIVLSHMKILYVLYVCTYVILQQDSFPHLGLAVEERGGGIPVLSQLPLLPLVFFCFFVRYFLRVSIVFVAR